MNCRRNHRRIERVEVYLSIERVNTTHIGWSNTEDIVNFMVRNPDTFTYTKLGLAQPISKLEAAIPSDPTRDFLAVFTIPLTEFVPKSDIPKSVDPNRSFVFAYTPTKSVLNLIESIRVELSRRLLELA